MRSSRTQIRHGNATRLGRSLALGLVLAWLLTILLGAAPPAQAQPAALNPAPISPHLATALATSDAPQPVLVVLKAQVEPLAVTAALAEDAGLTPEERRIARATALYRSLTAHAAAAQAPLLAWLDARGIPYRRYYIVNLISLDADAALAEQLRRRPEVARLVANPTVHTLSAVVAPPALGWALSLQPADTPNAPALLYGLEAIGAPALWARGIRGQGIVLAGQDTGVEWEHPALRARYRGWDGQSAVHDYHWFDAWAGTPQFDPCAGRVDPCDDNGHGTHTVGTLVGHIGTQPLGAAPDARWMGCRNMLRGFGTPESYIACFQFFLAPYPQGGDPLRDGRPELAPHILNNSWGCPPYEGCDADTLAAVVEVAHAAGQLVVASAGNSGPGCSSVRDPIAIYADTLTVGSHDASGAMAGSSSRGPVTVDGSARLKPDISAPGVGIYSAYRGGGYAFLSGTSMAGPHVAAGAALLWSAFPYLVGEPELTRQLLIKSATPMPSALCTGGDTPVRPNPVSGYGRLNLVAAWEMAQRPWHVAVEVTGAGGQPLAGATVHWIDEETGYQFAGTTVYNGQVRHAPLFAGRYTLQVTVGDAQITVTGIALNATHEEVTGEAGDATLRVRYVGRAEPRPEPRTYYLPWLRGP